MQLSIEIIFTLALVAGLAGFIDAIAGGGGLLTIPAMLVANIPPVYTLGTNKLQASFGSFAASLAMIKKGKVQPKAIWQSIVACFFGSVLGTLAVMWSPPETLTKIIPILIGSIGIYTLFAPQIGEVEAEPRIGKNQWQFGAVPLMGFYDGYLGAGVGMFYTLGNIALRGREMVAAIANAKVLNFTSNIASLIFFILGGKVLWAVGGAMIVGQFLGGYFGAHTAIKGGSKLIRPVIVLVCLAMLVKYVFFS